MINIIIISLTPALRHGNASTLFRVLQAMEKQAPGQKD
jgi:hypothetical protein